MMGISRGYALQPYGAGEPEQVRSEIYFHGFFPLCWV